MIGAGEVPQCRGMAFIPGGMFLMGCHDGEECQEDERPAHNVTVSAFQVDRCDFTERQMEGLKRSQPRKFGDIKTSCDIGKPRGIWNWIKGWFGKAEPRTESCDKPLADVTWTQTDAICRARGMRLWREAEYEYLARGPSGQDAYGTAGGARPTEGNARFGGFGGRADVGSYAPKMWGREAVYDLAGNVWKWVSDWYGPYSATVATNPQGPFEGYARVVRGGSWSGSHGRCGRILRSAYRHFVDPESSYFFIGVRCAAAPRTPETK